MILLPHVGRPARGETEIPGGKSAAIRGAFLAAQAHGTSELLGCPDSEDVERALAWIAHAGAAVERSGCTARITGLGGPPLISGAFDAGSSGAVFRFGSFFCAAGRGDALLEASPQLARRPMGEGAQWLRGLGAEVDGDAPPWRMRAHGLEGGPMRAAPRATSQFLSGCLLSAPSFRRGADVSLPGRTPSFEYVRQTLDALAQFGATVEATIAADGAARVAVGAGRLSAACWLLPCDASIRLIFACVPAVLGGAVVLRGPSAPRDAGLSALTAAGVEVEPVDGGVRVAGRLRAGIAFDGDADPDLLPPLAVAALFAPEPSRFRGTARLQWKESRRLAELQHALEALGARVELGDAGDSMMVIPGTLRRASLTVAGDHRLAMSYALAGLAVAGLELDDADCVRKSVGDFFARLRAAVG